MLRLRSGLGHKSQHPEWATLIVQPELLVVPDAPWGMVYNEDNGTIGSDLNEIIQPGIVLSGSVNFIRNL